MTVQQKSYKVLVIGDACIDAYIHTHKINRENPEALAPIMALKETKGYEERDGMALNVAKCLTNLGFKVRIITGANRSVKFRIVDDTTGEQILRIDSDKVSEAVDQYNSDIDWINYDAVVISDYNKGSVSLDTLKYVADNFKGPKFLDTKKKDIGDLWPHFIVKINEPESYDYVSPMTPDSIITMGADGAVKAGITHKVYPPLLVPEVDVCGAGDAFLAGLVYGKFFGTILEDIEYGIVNAGISVTQVGTYAPTEEELEKATEKYYDQTRRAR